MAARDISLRHLYTPRSGLDAALVPPFKSMLHPVRLAVMQKQRSMIEWRKGQSIGVIQDKRDAFYWVIRLEGFNFVEQDEACISCSLVKDEERYYPAGRYDHWRQGDSVFLILECDLDKDASCLDTLLHRS